MGFDAGTVALVEDALSECFKYHAALNSFLTRSGVASGLLQEARGRAERRNEAHGRFAKAPKRLVVQEVLASIADDTAEENRILAAIITGLTKSEFREASQQGLDAVAQLKVHINADRENRNRERQAAAEERAASARAAEQAQEARRFAREASRDSLRERFEALMSEGNAQTRGYLLEQFLNDLFDFEGLDPRRSFKLVSEQIDGSFAWRGRTCLVEAKWVRKPVAGADFGAFNYKLEGKTVDTRGVYISINGYSPQAIEGMNAKGALKFVCLDGAHIMGAVLSSDGLEAILERVWRHADETGESYLPVSRLG